MPVTLVKYYFITWKKGRKDFVDQVNVTAMDLMYCSIGDNIAVIQSFVIAFYNVLLTWH
jgi:hypothetical protein